ncbi:hypothetical protein [Tenacibaculum halocynthiae]|uniref:hypothetical protein n=1 Tax=Tenacibaculum halocynthiae TaxID=1254437 RepID=UPI003D64C8F4
MKRIDILNTLLLLISILLAYILPFELFLLSYAVLGPLHYLTEINWIRDNSYFVSEKKWLFISIVLTIIVSISPLLSIDAIYPFVKNTVLDAILKIIKEYSNIAIFMCFMLAIIFLTFKKKKTKIIASILIFLFGLWFVKKGGFNLLFGILMPTIIHVYIFTLLFMWYGSIKSNSKMGFFNVWLIVLIPLVILFFPFELSSSLTDHVKSIYIENKFYVLNTNLSKIFNFSDGSTFNFSDTTVHKIQMFISFAYTYHYLNWFSKTNIIGWGKSLNYKKIVIIVVLWILAISLFVLDYKLGVVCLLFLSFIHVFLEFPINIISIKGIFKHYKKEILFLLKIK